MSPGNGNKKDPELRDAEASGDFAANRYVKAKKIYDRSAWKRDCRDDLIDAQEQYLIALANTLDQYQKRFGDIDILQKKLYIEEGEGGEKK